MILGHKIQRFFEKSETFFSHSIRDSSHFIQLNHTTKYSNYSVSRLHKGSLKMVLKDTQTGEKL